MTEAMFSKLIEHVIWLETAGDKAGGYTDDPQDPGGETRWGISKRYNPDLDIKNLTKAQAIERYYQKYWLAQFADKLPPMIAATYFDCSVNPGEGWARRALQEAINVHGGRLKVDGAIGPLTIAAARKANPFHVAEELAAQRALYYTSRLNFRRYGKGWMRRCFQTHTLSVTE